MSQPNLIIFDFDGTLFDTRASILHTIRKTFSTLLPSSPPTDAALENLLTSGTGLTTGFRNLHPSPETFDEETWIKTYRSIYSNEGQALTKPFPGVAELLSKLKEAGIPIAVVSNKAVGAVKEALGQHGLGGVFPEELIVGDHTPGAERKPHPGAFTDVLVPVLKTLGVEVDGAGVVVVGDTVPDISFARNIGARVCWCRFGHGDAGVCEGMGPDFVVDSLDEVLKVVGL